VRGQDIRNKLANLDLSKFNQEFEKIVQEQDALIVKVNTLQYGNPEYIEINKRIAEIENRKQAIENEKLVEQRKTLYVENPSLMSATYKSRDKAVLEKQKQGVAEFNNLVSKDLSIISVSMRTTSQNRSYYDNNNGVYLNKNRPVSTVIHELGHHLEHSDPYVFEKALQFYDKRTQGEKAEKLSTLTGIKSYKSYEKARKDNFVSPYMGKEYLDKNGNRVATEIISMGMEYMWKDPVGFSQADPDYFDFMIDVLRKTY